MLLRLLLLLLVVVVVVVVVVLLLLLPSPRPLERAGKPRAHAGFRIIDHAMAPGTCDASPRVYRSTPRERCYGGNGQDVGRSGAAVCATGDRQTLRAVDEKRAAGTRHCMTRDHGAGCGWYGRAKTRAPLL